VLGPYHFFATFWHQENVIDKKGYRDSQLHVKRHHTVCACARMCVCVCVRERERERSNEMAFLCQVRVNISFAFFQSISLKYPQQYESQHWKY